MAANELAPFGKLIVYKKDYTKDFIQKTIKKDNLEGLRIFAHLKEDKLDSLDFLKEYSFLKRLDITTVIKDDFNYDFLDSLPNIENLSLSIAIINAKSINPIPLKSLVNLKTLSIGYNQQFQGIENCTKIENLYLNDFQQPNLKNISCLPNMKLLQIKQSTLTELDGIDSFKFLETAFFGHCKRLKNIQAINGLLNLRKMIFDGCPKLKTVNYLNQLPNLEMLELIDCKEIESLAFLTNLPNLQDLKFGGTVILDGDLTPAQKIKTIFYGHKKHYNITLDTTLQEENYIKNMQRLKELGFKK